MSNSQFPEPTPESRVKLRPRIVLRLPLVTLAVLSLAGVLSVAGKETDTGGGGSPTGKVITYPAPAEKTDFYAKSEMFSVKVDGKDVFVYDFDPTNTLAPIPGSLDPKPANWDPGVFGSFDFSGKVTVSVTVKGMVEKADIRPRSLGIQTRVEGNVVSFDLTKPVNFGLEINGSKEQPLFLFANPILPVPDKNDPNVVFIEGGKIHEDYVWPDVKGKTLYLEGGSIVRCKKGISTDLTGTKILGTGIVTGQAPTVDQHIFGWTAPSKNFLMDGPIFVSTHKGGKWAVVPFKIEDGLLHNVKVLSLYRDALDVLSCRNLTVDNCFLWSRDDACVIKASQWAEGWNVTGITVKNSTIWNHGLMIGFETRAPYMEDISFKNCDIVRYCSNTGNPLAPQQHEGLRNPVIGIAVSDQAKVSNIRYEDIRIEDPWTDVFFQFMIDKNYASTHGEKGRIKGVYAKNIRVIDTDKRLTGIYRSSALGMDDIHTVSNILIEGLVWEGKELSGLEETQFKLNSFASNIVVQPLASRTTAPTAPTDLASVSPGGFLIRLSWKDTANNEDGFILERRKGTEAWQEIAHTVANHNEWYDRRLEESAEYHYRIRSFNEAGESGNTPEITAIPLGRVPFKGQPHVVPGIIEAEDFDIGGDGISWHDTTSGNTGGSKFAAGRYRDDVDPDIGLQKTDIIHIGWLAAKEWLEYTIEVAEAGTYQIAVDIDSAKEGGKFHLQFDGVDKTGPVLVPASGGWGTYQPVTIPNVELKAGRQVMRFHVDMHGFGLDKLKISK